MSPEAKKLVLVLATSTPVTETREEADETAEAIETAEAVESTKVGKGRAESEGEYPSLARILCIRYPITFRKKSMSMSALFDSSSEVNAIHRILGRKLGLPVRLTDVGA